MKKTSTVQNLKKRIAELSIELSKINEELDSIANPDKEYRVSGRPRIIPFPGTERFQTEIKPLIPYKAFPGMVLPPDIPDYRKSLQRDGLILLGWDKRRTEAGERFTAYWVTSAGISRFYASKQYEPENFPLALPDHKSYAAEDGIEFYGQGAPVYIVHTAPELMMSNPLHSELRPSHIKKLKKQGIDVDFKYNYLLTYERNRSGKKAEKAGA